MTAAQNPVSQLEQSLATLNTPAVAQAFRAYGPRPTAAQALVDVPAAYQTIPVQIPNVSPSYSPSNFLATITSGRASIDGPTVLIAAFGVSLLATIMGSGTVRTLGVVGMLGTAGLFLAGVSQIH